MTAPCPRWKERRARRRPRGLRREGDGANDRDARDGPRKKSSPRYREKGEKGKEGKEHQEKKKKKKIRKKKEKKHKRAPSRPKRARGRGADARPAAAGNPGPRRAPLGSVAVAAAAPRRQAPRSPPSSRSRSRSRPALRRSRRAGPDAACRTRGGRRAPAPAAAGDWAKCNTPRRAVGARSQPRRSTARGRHKVQLWRLCGKNHETILFRRRKWRLRSPPTGARGGAWPRCARKSRGSSGRLRLARITEGNPAGAWGTSSTP